MYCVIHWIEDTLVKDGTFLVKMQNFAEKRN
jgi:hypothetical protein